MFGHSGTENGHLMLSRSGFEGTGNGYSNETDGKNTSNAVTTHISNGSSVYDLNEFPSLGVGGGTSSGGENNGLAAALRQQQQLLAQQKMIQRSNGKNQSSNLYRLAMGSSLVSSSGSMSGTNFNMATEDFPALPGAPPSGSSGGNVSSGSGLLGDVEGGQRDVISFSSTTGSTFRKSVPPVVTNSSNGSGLGMFSGDVDVLSNHLDSNTLLSGSVGVGSVSILQSTSINTGITQQQRAPTTTTQHSGSIAPSSVCGGAVTTGGSALSGDYGLLGLLGVIRMSDADRNALALGSDLTTLGLNLNSSDQLYSTFASPWSESPTTREPQYQLPMCYYMQAPALKTGHLEKFQLETLFYIFYALPKDVLQAYAAQELYSREWRYHVDLKLWFKRAGPSDGVVNTGSCLQYIYFDINSWERRLFNGNMNQNITSGLLSDDEIQVKYPNS